MIIFNADFVENEAVLLGTMVASEFWNFREGQWQGTFLRKFPENASIADFLNCELFYFIDFIDLFSHTTNIMKTIKSRKYQISVSELNPIGTAEIPGELFS